MLASAGPGDGDRMGAGQSLALKLVAGVAVLVASFWLTLYFIDAGENDRQAMAQAEAIDAQSHAVAAGGGLRVYSPDMAHEAPFTPERAFSGVLAADRFWETHSEFPVDLIVILPAARDVAGYSLAAGELSERMPVSWELDGSLDGARWVALDRQPRIPRWHANETRSFRIAVQGSSRLLRFRFLAGQDPRIMRIYKIALQ
jgi:hypothetical protein